MSRLYYKYYFNSFLYRKVSRLHTEGQVGAAYLTTLLLIIETVKLFSGIEFNGIGLRSMLSMFDITLLGAANYLILMQLNEYRFEIP